MVVGNGEFLCPHDERLNRAVIEIDFGLPPANLLRGRS